MAQSFRLGNRDWQEKYNALILNIGQNMLDRDGVVNLVDYMMYSLGREMSCMAKEFQDLWLTEGACVTERASIIRYIGATGTGVRGGFIRSVRQYARSHGGPESCGHDSEGALVYGAELEQSGSVSQLFKRTLQYELEDAEQAVPGGDRPEIRGLFN